MRYQHPSSNSSKPTIISSGNPKSSTTVPLASTLAPQRGYGFQGDSSFPDARLGHPQSKSIFTQRTSPQRISTPKRGTEIDFPWSLSSISPGEDLPTEILSETSEEGMIDYTKSIFSPFTWRDENTTLHLFPLDYTSRSDVKRPSFGVFRVSMRDSSSQTPCSEQSIARKNSNGATGAAHDADKPQGETQACTSGSSINRSQDTVRKRGGSSYLSISLLRRLLFFSKRTVFLSIQTLTFVFRLCN